ncbi:flagellar hook-length control protein FliK [Rhizobium sp. YIM 134829]|uniref:flagellar hook-length control protein FliK n=1 Tax=Rhizobium sp. YIM 134829 TaxID=3390453 RepID=UPI003979CA5E
MTSIDEILTTAMPVKGRAKAGATTAHSADDDQAFGRAVTDLDKKPTHGKALAQATAKHGSSQSAAEEAAARLESAALQHAAEQSVTAVDGADADRKAKEPDSKSAAFQAAASKGRGSSGNLGATLRLSDAMRRAGQIDTPADPDKADGQGLDIGSKKAGTSRTDDAGTLSSLAARAAKTAEGRADASSAFSKAGGLSSDGSDQHPITKASHAKDAVEADDRLEGQAAPGSAEHGSLNSTSAGDTRQLFVLLGVAAPQARPVQKIKGSEDQAAGAQAAAEPTPELQALRGAGRSGTTHAEKNGAKAAASEPDAPADRLFRFASADGKASALSVSSGADGAKLGTTAEAASPRAETVTVLEARRYLGLASPVNTQAVTSAIAGSAELAQSLKSGGDPLQSGAGRVVNTLRIQMHPIDLGTVTATLRLKDDALQVELKVETGEAYRQLSDDQDAMIRALKAQGFAVDQITLVLSPAASGDGGQAPGQGQNQAGSGQAGRDPQNAFSSSGEGRQNDGSRNRQAPQEARPDLSGERAGAGRPGGQSGVYI